jgi:hypothetical protein
MNTQTNKRTTIGTTVTKASNYSTWCFECSTKIYIGDVVKVWRNKKTGEERAYGIACAYQHPKRFFGRRKPTATTATAKPTQAQIETPKPRKARKATPVAVAAYAAAPKAIEIEAPKPQPAAPKATKATTRTTKSWKLDLNTMLLTFTETVEA